MLGMFAGFKAEGRGKKTKFEEAFEHFPIEICKTLLKPHATSNSSPHSWIIKEIWPANPPPPPNNPATQ